ncbi:autotransporter-associated beta strand repeat-containing protein, partial [Martelella sp. FLE1502]
SATQNWTDSTGTNASAWAKSVAYFQGTSAGTVTVVGTQAFDKLVFSAQDYLITGDSLALSPRTNTTGTIEVDTVTATIASDIIDGKDSTGGDITTLEKVGTGTLVLINTKSFTGEATVAEGTLQLGDGTTNGVLGHGITINDSATLAINQTGTLGFANSLTGGANPGQALLNVTGTGQLNFTSSSSAFNGLTTISNGTFNITGALGGDVKVTGGTLQGTGTLGGDVTIESGGTLSGDISIGSPLVISGELTLTGTSILSVALNASPNAAALITTKTLNMVGGSVQYTPSTLATGQYNLISYTDPLPVGSAATNLTLTGAPANYSLQAANGFLYILVSSPGGEGRYWHPNQTPGASNFGGPGTWVASSDTNWSDNTGTPLGAWVARDIAIFKGSADTVTVDSNTQGPITINGMTFEVPDYLISSGAGSNQLILDDSPGEVKFAVNAGAAEKATVAVVLAEDGSSVAMEKTGGGILVLTAANTYSGGTTVSTGTLQLGDGTTNGSLTGGIDIAAAATLSVLVNAASPLATPLNFSNTLTATSASASFTIGGTGALSFASSSSSFAGATTVLTGATLTGNGNLGGTVTVSDGAMIAGNQTQKLTLGNLVLTNGTPGSTILADLSTANAASLFSTGELTAAGIVRVTGSPLPASTDPYYLIDYTSLVNSASDIKIDATSPGLDPATTNASVVSIGGNRIAIIIGPGNTPAGGTDIYWNGTTTTGSVLTGGPGTWTASSADLNWTDLSGASHGPWLQSKYAVFAAGTGTVLVDSTSSGAISVEGLDFQVSGYQLDPKNVGDGLTLESAFSDGLARLNVATASQATISADLTGSGGVRKTGAGNLLFTGDKTYTGSTSVVAGVLQLGANTLTGSVAGDIAVSAGATLSLYAPTGVTTSFANNLTGGSGALLSISGPGTTNFNTLAALSFTGSTTVENGSTLAGSGALGGTVTVAGGGAISGDATGGTTLALGSELDFSAANSTMVVTLDGSSPNTIPLFSTGDFNFASGGTIVVNTVSGLPLPASTQYALISYSGTRTSNLSLLTFSVPNASYSLADPASGTIYLVVETPPEQYWNPDQHLAAAGLGGKGTWTTTGGLAWSNAAGTSNGPWVSGATADFKDNGGNVTVNASGGPINVGGMNFEVGPYNFTGDALTLDSANTDPVKINVQNAGDVVSLGTVLAGATSTTGMEKDGAGTLVLNAINTYTGKTQVTAGTLRLGVVGTPLAGTIEVSGGAVLAVNSTGTVKFDTANVLSSTSNTAQLNIEAGTLQFDSASSGFMGRTNVASGATLQGTGNLGGNVIVKSGGTLAGSVLNPTFTLGDSGLTLASRSILDVTLNSTENSTALFSAGALTINNSTLNVTVNGGPGTLDPGTYHLIDYDLGLYGDPSQIDTTSVPTTGNVFSRAAYIGSTANIGTVVLKVGPDAYSYWNGTYTSPSIPPAVQGGPGTWTADLLNTNWTNQTGTDSEAWATNGYAIFDTVGGQVDVQSTLTSGALIRVSTMEFKVDGYSLQPTSDDIIVLAPAPGTASADINVVQTGPAVKAAIAVSLQGSTGLHKIGDGELELSGSNTYSGGTTLDAGTLTSKVAGAVPGAISIDQTATWNWDVAGSASFNGVISNGANGGGTFNVNAANATDILQLTANNTGFTGTTNVNTGVLNITGPAGTPNAGGLGGTINVKKNAKLQGYGPYGTINVATGGEFVIGKSDSDGTLLKVVADGLNIENRGQFSVPIDLTGSSPAAGHLQVNGDAVLKAGTKGFAIINGVNFKDEPVAVITATGAGTSYPRFPTQSLLGYTYGFAVDLTNSKVLNFTMKKNTTQVTCEILTRGSCGVLEAVDGLGEG